MPWLSGAISFVGGLFGSVADAVLKWAGIILAYRLGIRRERQKTAEKANETKDEQLKLAAKPALHRRGLLDLMFGRKRGK